jgi:hypothetical protein
MRSAPTTLTLRGVSRIETGSFKVDSTAISALSITIVTDSLTDEGASVKSEFCVAADKTISRSTAVKPSFSIVKTYFPKARF